MVDVDRSREKDPEVDTPEGQSKSPWLWSVTMRRKSPDSESRSTKKRFGGPRPLKEVNKGIGILTLDEGLQ